MLLYDVGRDYGRERELAQVYLDSVMALMKHIITVYIYFRNGFYIDYIMHAWQISLNLISLCMKVIYCTFIRSSILTASCFICRLDREMGKKDWEFQCQRHKKEENKTRNIKSREESIEIRVKIDGFHKQLTRVDVDSPSCSDLFRVEVTSSAVCLHPSYQEHWYF